MERPSVLTLIAQAAEEQWEELDLSGMNLTELPPEIGNLGHLKRLILGKWDQEEKVTFGNRLTTLPEELWQLQQLEKLDLSFNQFTALPEAIGNLTNLTTLHLWDNQLTTLPGAIGILTQLITLHLSRNQLTTLPEAIGNLTNLTTLDLSSNQFTALPEAIATLSHLTTLYLSGNQFTMLPKAIGTLTQLTALYLWNNQLTTLPRAIATLTNLTALYLRRNKLTSLPEAIGTLTNLTTLDLGSNKLTSLPEAIGTLTNLTTFDLSSNKLAALPEAIATLTHLTTLDLSHNNLTALPRAIGNLTHLTYLNLSRNLLTALPEAIGQLAKLRTLALSENSLSKIPPEVLKQGGLAVRNYYRQRLEEKTDYIYEAKLLIIGEGGAGKTTLANKLIDSKYQLKLEGGDNPEKSTEGIDVLRFDFPHSSGNSFRINIWDFGGQEIYHATHQFFLTKRSLYLLVADTRQDNTDFNYWLEVIELLSQSSPTIIIKNEKQDRPCQVNENQLRGSFPNLEKILPTNLANNRGRPEIRAAIKYHISQLPHIGTPLPKTWVRVREALEADTRNYITQAEFLALCDTHGFKRREDKLQLSGYLHDLGVCLHFQDDPVLKNWIILKPKWGTTAVYTVLDTPKVQQALGCFTHNDLAKIWADEQYSDMRDELLQLMMRFKLCYEIPHRPCTYIVPQLLSPNQPKYNWDDSENLILRYYYDFMPKGMLTRFTVEMHKLIDSDLVWKDGVILTDRNTRAEVIEAYYKNEIRIRVSGFPKKDLLTRIRHEFNKIHDSYEKLRYQELIPCNCPTCKGSQNPHAYVLQKLQERLQNQAYETECDQPPYHKVNVRRLIDDASGDLPTPEASSEKFSGKRDRNQGSQGKQRRKSTTPATPVIIENHIHNNNQQEQAMSGDKIWQGDRVDGDKVMGDKDTVAGNKMKTGDVAGDAIAGNKIVNTQTMTQTAQDIKVLVNQYASDYDTTTPSGKMGLSGKVIESIEQNPTLKSRALNALTAAGKTAFETAIDHPIAKVLVAGLEGYLE